jgi:hypothetical protein
MEWLSSVNGSIACLGLGNNDCAEDWTLRVGGAGGMVSVILFFTKQKKNGRCLEIYPDGFQTLVSTDVEIGLQLVNELLESTSKFRTLPVDIKTHGSGVGWVTARRVAEVSLASKP